MQEILLATAPRSPQGVWGGTIQISAPVEDESETRGTNATFKASANPYKSVIMELKKACPMIEQRMRTPTTNHQHQNYFIHRAWNQSDLQAMKMQMKDYDDNPEGFVEQMLFYVNSNKANHDDVIGLMATVLLVKMWRKAK